MSIYTKPDPKPEKRIKAKGKEGKTIQDEIFKRDHGRCVVCNQAMSPGEKYHHINYKSGGGHDSKDNGCMLCNTSLYEESGCHYVLHHKSVRKFIERIIYYYGLKRTAQFILKGMISGIK